MLNIKTLSDAKLQLLIDECVIDMSKGLQASIHALVLDQYALLVAEKNIRNYVRYSTLVVK